MARFGKRSRRNLNTCDKRLQDLFNEVVKHFDCSVLVGFAVDVAPYPIDWDDRERFIYFGGFVKGCAYRMNIPLRWGGDWDSDTQLSDNKFDDLVHFEVRKD